MAFVGNVTAAGNSAMPVAATLYGTCTTAAATQAKVVTCAAYDLATPITGMTIVIKFTNTNTYNGTVTLNINSKGAKNAYRYGTTNIGTTVQTSWPAGAAVSFTFDGTNWILTDPNYDTNSTAYLPTSGGTITGNLTAKFNGIDASLADNGVTSTQYPTTFNIVDKNDRILTRKEGVVSSDGNIAAYWYIRNYNTSGTQVAQKGIRMTMNKSGNLTYSVDDAANFRSAISAAAASHTHTSIEPLSTITGDTHALAVKSHFDANKANIPRNKPISYYSSAYGNGSLGIGYFLTGYNDSPYGGFFFAHYNNPKYVGIQNGSYTEQSILTSTNYTTWAAAASHTHNYAGSSSAGGDATRALAVKDAGNNNNITIQYSGDGISTASWFCAWDGYKIRAISAANTRSAIGAAASSHTHSYLPLSGGTLTGALSGTSATMSGAITAGGNVTFGNGTTATLIAKTPSRTDGILWVGGGKKTAGDANGTAVRLQGGGLMMVGSGEYPTNRYNLADLNDGDETLFLGSDGAVYVETNGQTIANRKTFTFGADGTFNSPSTIKQNGTAVSLSNHTHTISTTTATIKKPSAGTAIAADDITAWTTNTPTVVTKKTVVTAASGATAAISNGLLTLTNGSFTTGDSCTVTAGKAATLSYTARSIPNISLSDQTVVTGVTIS